MSHVDIDNRGRRVAVTTAGAGPRCLVLHGFMGSGSAMAPLVDRLGAAHEVLAPDLVGHGSSAKPDGPESYSMAETVGDVVSVLDHFGIDAAPVVGYSFGARVALSTAVAHPDRVSRLVTIGGTPGLSDPARRAERVALDGERANGLEREGIEAFVDRWERLPLFEGLQALPAERVAAIRAGRVANDARALANSLRGAGTGSMPSLWEALPGLAVPTTVIVGALDTKFVEIGRQMVAAIPDAALRLVDGAGHAAHLERPDECAAAVLEALAS